MAVADIRMNQHLEPVGIFAIGFLDSAAALLRRADNGAGMVDYAIYPGIYTLRHGIELFLKQMSIYLAYEAKDPSLLYVPGHQLPDAWRAISAEMARLADLLQFDPDFSDVLSAREHLDVLADTIDRLHELDPNGQIFRYPEWVSAPERKPRTRRDQPPPFDMVSLRDWASIAEAVFEAAKCFLAYGRERATSLAAERGDPPIHFHETVMNLRPVGSPL